MLLLAINIETNANAAANATSIHLTQDHKCNKTSTRNANSAS